MSEGVAQPAEGTETAEDKPSHHPDFPDKLVEFLRAGWRDQPLEEPPLSYADRLATRRTALAAAFPGETLIIPTGTEQRRNNDCFYPFRPGSDFFYLTGERDPDSVLVIHPSGAPVLFVHPRLTPDEALKSPQYGELWVGRRRDLAEKSALLGIETADLRTLPEALDALNPRHTRTLRGYDRLVDQTLAVRDDGTRDKELAKTLSEQRLVKDEWEIAQLRDAVGATVRGFEDAIRRLPAEGGISERVIEGVFGARARLDGNDVGYTSIVASGAHATTLHWIRNDGMINSGDLLLADMGVENRELYTADVTRTLPVSGTFTPLQREVYEIVLSSQQAGIDAIKPGVIFKDVHRTCMRVLCEGLVDLGVLPGSVDEAMDKDSLIYRRWTLHSFGHMLGLDVHDCARASKERYRDGALGEGYVLTVEPGLYFQPNDELVPAELRGLGIRIEDDILVTAAGAENLSAALPREPLAIERWLTDQRG